MHESHVWLGPKSRGHAPRHIGSLLQDYLSGCLWRLRRRFGLARGLCKCACLILMVVVTLVGAYVGTAYRSTICLEDETTAILNKLCLEYQKGGVTGDLCTDLCGSSRHFQYLQCLNYRGGKVVVLAKWRDEHVILKTKKPFIKQYNSVGYTNLYTGQEILPSMDEFYKMVATTVKYNLGISHNISGPDLLKQVLKLHINFDEFTRHSGQRISPELESKRQAAVVSAWSLVQQDEYLLMQYSQGTHMPKIYSTCGHFYAMEYVPPGTLLSPSLVHFNREAAGWKDRASLALKLMDVLQALDTHYKEPVHFCDMKGENFGLSKEGIVKAIDTDMALYESKLQSVLMSEQNCSHHEDCMFFDCKGWCNLATKSCTKLRINNNLQTLCDKVLRNKVTNAYMGLLQSPPQSIQSELEAQLHICAEPRGPENLQHLPGCTEVHQRSKSQCENHAQVPFSASPKVHQDLYKLLAKSVAEQQV